MYWLLIGLVQTASEIMVYIKEFLISE